MQSLANEIAVKLRREFDLNEVQYGAVEQVLYRLTDFNAHHSHEDAERWVRTLLATLKMDSKEADYTTVHTGYNLSSHKVYAVYAGSRKVGEISSYDNGVWYWRRRGAIVECDSMNEALESLSEFDRKMVASGIREGE